MYHVKCSTMDDYPFYVLPNNIYVICIFIGANVIKYLMTISKLAALRIADPYVYIW